MVAGRMDALEGCACLSWTDLLEQHGLLSEEGISLASVGKNSKVCVWGGSVL